MDTLSTGCLDQTPFNDSMNVNGFDNDAPWYTNMFLENPKSHHMTNLMNGVVSFARPQDIPWQSCQPLGPTFGPTSALSLENSDSAIESRDLNTGWPDIGSPAIKAEDDATSLFTQASRSLDSQSVDGQVTEDQSAGVDVLMKAIQSKCRVQEGQLPSPPATIPARRDDVGSVDSFSSSKSRKPRRLRDEAFHQCQVPSCRKVFTQRGRLNVHIRAHTGDKPYRCRVAGCGQYFSQMGNLKTHERRHTGERPFQCSLCNRSFAQSGNMRAHLVVHQKVKPFHCKLEDCGKRFTQLGNLKSHQNKFHAKPLQDLTCRFASLQEGDIVSATDKEFWEYFSSLYKHSNRGIQGRGRDRRISMDSEAIPNLKEEECQNELDGDPYAG